MAETKIPMTPRGLALLKDELRRRREIDRPKIVLAIEEARAHGDLSENADYSAAKEAQSFNEGRTKDLETMIARATGAVMAMRPRLMSASCSPTMV